MNHGTGTSTEKIKTLRLKIIKNSEAQTVNGSLPLSLLGVGLVYGDDDVLARRPYKSTLSCNSVEG